MIQNLYRATKTRNGNNHIWSWRTEHRSRLYRKDDHCVVVENTKWLLMILRKTRTWETKRWWTSFVISFSRQCTTWCSHEETCLSWGRSLVRCAWLSIWEKRKDGKQSSKKLSSMASQSDLHCGTKRHSKRDWRRLGLRGFCRNLCTFQSLARTGSSKNIGSGTMWEHCQSSTTSRWVSMWQQQRKQRAMRHRCVSFELLRKWRTDRKFCTNMCWNQWDGDWLPEKASWWSSSILSSGARSTRLTKWSTRRTSRRNSWRIWKNVDCQSLGSNRQRINTQGCWTEHLRSSLGVCFSCHNSKRFWSISWHTFLMWSMMTGWMRFSSHSRVRPRKKETARWCVHREKAKCH